MGKAEGRIKRLSIVIVLTVVVTLLLWWGIGQALRYIDNGSSIEYCASCHAMKLPYTEFKDSKHYKSRSGVSPRCVDCHEDKSARSYIFHKIMGTSINSPEEFESKRMELAEEVWDKMKALGPRGGCRNCHAFENMDFTKLPGRAQEKHQEAMEEGKTCTDCHKGIVHMMPEEDEG